MSTLSRMAAGAAAVVLIGSNAWSAQRPSGGEPVYLETMRDAPAAHRAADNLTARSDAARPSIGGYTSVQVNIDALGMNIIGDAANEPSIAVNPANPQNIVIGWRQFDSIASDFRQAGWAFSLDGGESWTFPGVINPGVFRSDPVLAISNTGQVHYQSLRETFFMDVFTSLDAGASWLPPTFSWGGDKNWMAIDNSGGAGDGNLYGTWQRFFGCCDQRTLTRSVDGGQSFEPPIAIPARPFFGTMAVGPDGELYITGGNGTFTQDTRKFVIAKLGNPNDPAQAGDFTATRIEMGGAMRLGVGPNPGGLLGQANVAVDRSQGPRRGAVYVLASVRPDGDVDPMDVHLIRSNDGAATFSAPIRVNQDPVDNGKWQWFGAHDVASDGRIDVVWADSRNGAQPNYAELFYAYSYDGGDTWLGDEPVSPTFNSFLGYPQQNKIGDYYTIVSGGAEAHVAYAATFNDEQDVYYVRVFPDCNANAVSDVTDIANGDSNDGNADHIPDECGA